MAQVPVPAARKGGPRDRGVLRKFIVRNQCMDGNLYVPKQTSFKYISYELFFKLVEI